MTDHVCGPPYAQKKAGCCLCCGAEVREVVDYFVDGPRATTPRRLGPWKDMGTQVEFLMSDGSEADITFCLLCAHALQPSHYQAIWNACIDLADLSLRMAGRADSERTAVIAQQIRVWPIALLRKRRRAPELPLGYVVDRR